MPCGYSRGRILLLDYSVDRSEAPLFTAYIPEDFSCETVYVYFNEEIPSPYGYTHVIHTGSSASICEKADYLADSIQLVCDCVEKGIPQLGVCYGHQLLCLALLGRKAVERCSNGIEAGWVEVSMRGEGLNIAEEPLVRVLQSHFDRVNEIPRSSEIIAANEHTAIQGFLDEEKLLLGLQFHPEFTREEGNRLFEKDRELLEQNGIDLDGVLSSGPSLNTGDVFIGHFLRRCWRIRQELRI
ncbi:MAG: hypothetical protein GF388_09890 [Candidatus Aegiribacteria sp.]|nr:hypothetical protein [Candidatus Aegiribacteria sp.]MBD3295343.1 hypothetical protein [Candidatus Fermentibacteria bacterium]